MLFSKKKEIYCALLSVLFFGLISNAQDTHVGLKAGLNYSSVVGNLTEGLKFRLSGHAGVFLESEFTDKFAVQTELLYSSQGFQFSSDLQALENNGVTFDENDFRTNVQFNYLVIPVLGKFALNNRLDVELGPQFGFLINQLSKIKNLDQRDDTVPENKMTTPGNFQLDYGVAVGLTYHLNNELFVEPRFYIGLRNRLNGLDGTFQNYNVALQLSLGYAIF